ncbi:MAG: ParA family protein [Rickettsiales bacterium]|jgi:chromosome partitioning protein|nr:ParA family protein [Rickettsiales bacterium]
MTKTWTTNTLAKLFKLKDGSKAPIIYAEEKGEIPQAKRAYRGNINVRQWETKQLPLIGERFSFLNKPKSQHVICIYTPKGGVIKTSFALNMARMLAINNIKILIIGLDFQQSITRYALPTKKIDSLDEIKNKNPYLGLFHFLYENASLSEIIIKTDLPSLDIVPETHDLNFMTKKMRVENRREYIFKERVITHLSNYDVIIFDCNPGWSDLIENALVASTSLIMPIACEIECFEALQSNLKEIENFSKAMRLNWEHHFMIPTLLENNIISQNIYASYLNNYQKNIFSLPIRRSVIGQEARLCNISAIEHNPTSNLAEDYYELMGELWKSLNN